MSNRQQRRAFAASQTWTRVVPYFKSTDGMTLEESVQTSVIDGDLGKCFVIRVPPSTSIAQMKAIEEQLTQELSKPCLVVTRNIEFCRTEPVDRNEMAALLKGAENNGPTEEERRTVSLGSTVGAALASARERAGDRVEPDAHEVDHD